MKDTCIKDHDLSAYLDQALTGQEVAALRAHLARCRACQQRLDALIQIDEAVRSLPGITPSADFDGAFWSKVGRIQTTPTRLEQIKTFFAGWRPLLAASVAAMLIAATLVVFRHDPQAPTAGEIFMAENMNLLNDFELIQNLDLLEDWEAIQEMKVEG